MIHHPCLIICLWSQFVLQKSAQLVQNTGRLVIIVYCALYTIVATANSVNRNLLCTAPQVRRCLVASWTGIYLLWLWEGRNRWLLNGVCRCALNAGKVWGVRALQRRRRLWARGKKNKAEREEAEEHLMQFTQLLFLRWVPSHQLFVGMMISADPVFSRAGCRTLEFPGYNRGKKKKKGALFSLPAWLVFLHHLRRCDAEWTATFSASQKKVGLSPPQWRRAP